MIHDKWFIGDTHFFHTNTWEKFKNDDGTPMRPFESTQVMNEHMITMWNSVVKENDYVYHLGDVTFRYDGAFVALMQRLKGKKRLILGNHDRIKGTKLMDFFEKVDLWKGFKEHNFTLSHMPLPLTGLRDGKFCVHGHTHQNILSDPHYINVCVETRNYTPVHLDTILAEIKKVK